MLKNNKNATPSIACQSITENTYMYLCTLSQNKKLIIFFCLILVSLVTSFTLVAKKWQMQRR
jgi:hypothetical protein